MRIKTKKFIKDNLGKLSLDGISYEIVGSFIEDIMKHEGVSYDELRLIGEGSTSTNVKIGEYVLKIGHSRRTSVIKNHERILQPVIRREIPTGEEGEGLFLEVQNFVEADWYKKIPSQDIFRVLYAVYKDLRDAGLVWTDVKMSNVGRLIKDNRVTYTTNVGGEDRTLEPMEAAVNLRGDVGKVLKAGEYVIIDSDYIFDEKEIKKVRF